MARLDARSPKKTKLVRDSFTIPKAEYAVIGDLKDRALGLGVSVKKSELLRAGLKLLQQLDDATLKVALAAVPALKTGRPASTADAPVADDADASTDVSRAPEVAETPTPVKRRPARPRRAVPQEASAEPKPRRRARQAAPASTEATPAEVSERPVRARRAARRTARAEAAASAQGAVPAAEVSASESATTPQK